MFECFLVVIIVLKLVGCCLLVSVVVIVLMFLFVGGLGLMFNCVFEVVVNGLV